MNQSKEIIELRSHKDLILEQASYTLKNYLNSFTLMDAGEINVGNSDFIKLVWERLLAYNQNDPQLLLNQSLSISSECYHKFALNLKILNAQGYRGMTELLNSGTKLLSLLFKDDYWSKVNALAGSEQERSYRSSEFKLAAIFLMMAILEDLRLNGSEIYNIGILPKAKIVWMDILKYILLSILLLLLLGLVKGF